MSAALQIFEILQISEQIESQNPLSLKIHLSLELIIHPKQRIHFSSSKLEKLKKKVDFY